MTIRERYSRLRPKIAHRALRRDLPPPGCPRRRRPGPRGAADGPRSTARPCASPAGNPLDGGDRLVWAPCWPARMLHFPIRSFEQYVGRVETPRQAGGPTEDRGAEAADAALQARAARPQLRAADARGHRLERELQSERLVLDDTVGRVLAADPAPLEEPSIDGREPAGDPSDEQIGDLGEIEFDAMQSLARNQRTLMRRLDRAQANAGKRPGWRPVRACPGA